LHDGHILGDTGIEILGQGGVFNGLKLRCVVDNNSPEKISFLPYPAIGIKTSDYPVEYEYFTPNDFPIYTQEMVGQLSGKTQPILAWSITEEEALELLYKKGYPKSISYKTISPIDFNTDNPFSTKLYLQMDIVFNRLIAKTAFNYFVYHEKREISLLPKFDPIRNFIRYGTPSDFIKIRHSIGKVENFKEKKNSHIIGLVWGEKSCRSLYGIVSWFQETTHSICLTDYCENIVRDLPMSIFDNDSKQIETVKQFYVL
jgi:hypothetical protein